MPEFPPYARGVPIERIGRGAAFHTRLTVTPSATGALAFGSFEIWRRASFYPTDPGNYMTLRPVFSCP